MEHTPEPLLVKRGQYMSSVERPIADGEAALDGLIAFTYHANHYENARLFGAAPDLLAVLLEIEWGIDTLDGGKNGWVCPYCSGIKSRRGHTTTCRLNKAIAKAKGTPHNNARGDDDWGDDDWCDDPTWQDGRGDQ